MKMETNKRIKLIRAVSIVLAAAVVVAVLLVLGPILEPKYLDIREGSLTAEYYAHAKETRHDVLLIGDCEVYESFVPAVLWEEYGISSYVRGGSQHLAWHSYYMLEDALRYETPEIVVYNVLALKYGEPQQETYNRMALDGMEWSQTKVDAINASMMEDESFASYVWPLLRFHDRWSELTADDFKYAFADKPLVSDSGYLMQTDIRPMTESETVTEPAEYPLPETSMAYLDRMRVLCKERGITLILIKAPTNTEQFWWYDEWDAQITEYAATHGLAYYNMIDKTEEIGIDWSHDTYDEGYHLNVYGAEKLSVWFGRILQEEFDAPDRREDEALARVWEARVDRYDTNKKQSEENTTKEGRKS